MACLNSFDLIAYPGSRYVTTFRPRTGAEFRSNLTDALSLSGWTVTRSDITGGGQNDGTGYKVESQIPDWCLDSPTPVDWLPRCKLHIIPKQSFSSGLREYTEYKLLNHDETLSSGLDKIKTVPCIGAYVDPFYMFIGNPYQFFCFLLGSAQRAIDHVDDTDTNIIAGVPQIPKFLQLRDSRCGYGIQDMSFMWQPARMGPLRRGAFAGIVTGPDGSWCSTVSGGNVPMIHYGGDGIQVGLRFYGIAHPESPDLWSGMFFPPILSWQSNPSDGTTDKMKGFLWDCVVVNKKYQCDTGLSFDNHQFTVFNEWAGTENSNTPEHALMIAISGQF